LYYTLLRIRDIGRGKPVWAALELCVFFLGSLSIPSILFCEKGSTVMSLDHQMPFIIFQKTVSHRGDIERQEKPPALTGNNLL